jgi:hypothetical protein
MGDEGGGSGNGRGTTTSKKQANINAAMQEPVRGKGSHKATGTSYSSTGKAKTTGGFDSPMQASNQVDIEQQEKGNFGVGFETRTQAAMEDLTKRGQVGQINDPLVNVVSPRLNIMGKKAATNIRTKIEAGGIPVYDTTGRIQGVVSKNALGRDVYTGGGVDPIADPSGTRLQKGIGYVQQERGAFGNYGPVGLGMKAGGGSGATVGGDNGDGGVTTTQTAATATDVTGSTTSLSSAARRLAAGGAAGGASRRQFI